MAKLFSYLTNCVASDGPSIIRMVDQAREITLPTLRRHCDILDFEQGMGYDTGQQRGGLRMRDDYAVSYFKSVFKGRPCYYIQHSAIEYIFT